MKKIILLLALSQGLCAQIALAEAQIGRLFTTPAERSSLEYLRQNKKNTPARTDEPIQETISEPAPIVLPEAINMQGYVKRNDGKQSTVWINDKAMQEGTGNQDVRVGKLPKTGNRIPIKLHANGKYFSLKAGQVYDPENNRVHEARSHAAQGDAANNGRIGDEDAP